MEILPYYLVYKITWQRRDRSDAFPLYPTMLPSTTTNFRIVKNTDKNISQEWNSQSFPFYNKPDYLQNLADSIKGHLGYDYDHLLFSSTEFRASHSKTDITKSHCKIDGSCCNHHQLTNFATVTSVMKQLNK
jgi:hypothetical protein